MSITGAFIPTIICGRGFHRGDASVSLNKRAHPYYQNILHGSLDSYYIMGYSPEKYANNYERGITHDGH